MHTGRLCVVYFMSATCAECFGCRRVGGAGECEPGGRGITAPDRDGDPHISYFDNRLSAKGPKHATCNLSELKSDTATEWTIGKVADGGGSHTSIAIDSLDNIHISYCRGGATGDLMYATTAE